MIRSNSRPLLLAIAVMALSLAAPAAFSQSASTTPHPVIVLTELSSPSSNSIAGKLAATVTSSVDLLLRMTGDLSVERADYLSPTTAFDRAKQYYRRRKADGAVYGAVTANQDGTYTIDLHVWNASTPDRKPAEIAKTISNLLSSFEVGDELSLTVASTVVGRSLSVGTLDVANVAALGKYAVYADGNLLGRNRATFHVLAGARTIIVAKPGDVGDVSVQTFHVQIRPDETTTVTLSQTIPSADAKVITAPSTVAPPARPPAGGNVLVTAKTAGTLFVDNTRKSHVKDGASTWVANLKAGPHRFEMVYDDGRTENRSVAVAGDTPMTVAFTVGGFAPPPLQPDRPWIYFDGKRYNRGFFGDYPRLMPDLLVYPGIPVDFRTQLEGDYSRLSRAARWRIAALGVGTVFGVTSLFAFSGQGTSVGFIFLFGGALLTVVTDVIAAISENRTADKVIQEWNTYPSAHASAGASTGS